MPKLNLPSSNFALSSLSNSLFSLARFQVSRTKLPCYRRNLLYNKHSEAVMGIAPLCAPRKGDLAHKQRQSYWRLWSYCRLLTGQSSPADASQLPSLSQLLLCVAPILHISCGDGLYFATWKSLLSQDSHKRPFETIWADCPR